MSDFEDRLKALKAELIQTRDELRVQMHLARADARDEWDELEGKWAEFERKMDKVEEAAEDAAKEIGSALSTLGAEIREGYQRIRDAI